MRQRGGGGESTLLPPPLRARSRPPRATAELRRAVRASPTVGAVAEAARRAERAVRSHMAPVLQVGRVVAARAWRGGGGAGQGRGGGGGEGEQQATKHRWCTKQKSSLAEGGHRRPAHAPPGHSTARSGGKRGWPMPKPTGVAPLEADMPPPPAFYKPLAIQNLRVVVAPSVKRCVLIIHVEGDCASRRHPVIAAANLQRSPARVVPGAPSGTRLANSRGIVFKCPPPAYGPAWSARLCGPCAHVCASRRDHMPA